MLEATMRRLTEPELKMWLAKLSHDYDLNSPLSLAEIATRYHQAARLEFPLGELMNRRIRGFIWAWQMQAGLRTARIQKGDRFNAQGLEGKCVVQTVFSTALLAASDVVVHVDPHGLGAGPPR